MIDWFYLANVSLGGVIMLLGVWVGAKIGGKR